MFVTDFSILEVETKLREIAAERPEFRYNTTGHSCACFYDRSPLSVPRDDKTQGCIFGEAFFRLGVSKERLSELTDYIGDIYPAAPGEWSNVQEAQDGGATWGEAIKLLDA